MNELDNFIKEFKEAVDKRKEPKLIGVKRDWVDTEDIYRNGYQYEHRYKLDIGNGTYIETNGLIPETTINFFYRYSEIAYRIEFKDTYTSVRYKFHRIGDPNFYEEVLVIDKVFIKTMQDVEYLIKGKIDKFYERHR